MIDITSQEAVEGRCGEELHLKTAVVAACEAGFTGVANAAWFDGNAVAGFEVFDVGCHGEDLACRFVA